MIFAGTITNQILSHLALGFTFNSILLVFTNLHRFPACLVEFSCSYAHRRFTVSTEGTENVSEYESCWRLWTV